MTTNRTVEYLVGLVRQLCKLPNETVWVEFKVNNSDPREIGEYLSALANAAALNGKAFAYQATVSRYIREAVEAGMIKPFDEDASRKLIKYVPFWA